MIRQAVFALVFGLPLYATAQPAKPAPPVEIPITRLTADAVIPLAIGAGSVESDGAVWFLDRSAGSITRVDAKDNKPAPGIVIGNEGCASLVEAFDSVWAPMCGDGAIVRVDAKSPKVTATLKLKPAAADGRVATGVGSVWALTSSKGVLSRIDPDTNAPVAEVYVAAGAHSVVLAQDALWITSDGNAAKGRLTRVNPNTNEVVETIEVGPKPGRLVVGEGGVWILNRGDGTVTRVDPGSNKVVATITVGEGLAAGEIAAGLGSVWISAPGVPLVRIDPRTNRAVQRFTGTGGGAVLVAHGSLWLAAGPQLTWRLDPLLVAAIRP
jgi:virginiamycin B lyase